MDLSNASLTRRRMLRGAASMAAGSLISKGFGQHAAAQPVPPGTVGEAELTVALNLNGPIEPGFAGFSYEKSNVNGTLFASGSGANITPNASLVALFRLLGGPSGSVLRVAGNAADMNVWAGAGKGGRPDKIATEDVDRLAAFLKATGWKCLYGVNLGGSAPGAPFPTTKDLAAAEIAYAMKALGPSLEAIELGNEPDFWSKNFYKNAKPAWSVAQFISLWQSYRSYIDGIVKNVPYAGPDSAANTALLTVPFAEAVGNRQLSLVTQHYYISGGLAVPPPTVEDLIAYPSKHLEPNVLSRLQALKQSSGIPFRMDETNSFFDGGAKDVSNSYASALWVVDYLFTIARYGGTGANFQGGNNAPYTPIVNDDAAIRFVNPVFYGMKFFSMADTGFLAETKLDGVDGQNVTAYAVVPSTTPTRMAIVIVNKTADALKVAVKLPSGSTASSARLIEMTQRGTLSSHPDLTAKSGVTIQGSTIGANGSFAPRPAYALSLTDSGAGFHCFAPGLSSVQVQVKLG